MKPTLLDPSGKPEKVSSKLLELAKLESNKKHKILMTHWPVKEAIYANGFGPKNEPVYPLDDLKKLGYNVCIMGHVHKNQVLSEDPLVIHPGVAIRTELNEASVTPSVYIYNLETRSFRLGSYLPEKFLILNFRIRFVTSPVASGKTKFLMLKTKLLSQNTKFQKIWLQQ